VAHPTLDQILQGDAVWTCRLRHIPQLVLQVINFVFCLDLSLQLLNDLSEEHVDYKRIDRALVVDIQHTPEVLERLGRLFVFHGQHEVKERFVVHFSFKRLKLFENTVDEDLGQTRRIPCELGLLEHAVLV